MYDVIIIGGGPGGYKAAEYLGNAGKKVALIEKSALGGVCLNQGCIPFKSYLHMSKIRRDTCSLIANGLAEPAPKIHINQSNVYQYKNKVIQGLSKGVEVELNNCGVTIMYGEAVVSGNDDGVVRVSVAKETIEGKNLVVASGSEERALFVPEGLSYKVINSKEMLELEEIPKSIDIIGAGAIGLEAASFFCDAGSEVTVIDAMDHIGGHIDLEISKALERIYNKKGIKIFTNTTVCSFEADRVVYQNEDKKFEHNADIVLTAIGRKPSLDRESLQKLRVEYSEKGIVVDSHCRTNIPNVYACGDVTGKLMLAHTAYRQAKIISDTICGKESAIDYSVIPRVIYSNPEVLSIGKTEEDCVGTPYSCQSLPMTFSGKYFAENGKDGAKAKLIVDNNFRAIGFHMIGNGCSELSVAAELIIANKMTVEDIKNLVFAHPSYGEIIGELANRF